MPAVSVTGSKGGAGVAQRIVTLMPPHELYIEAFAGLAAVGRLKRPPLVATYSSSATSIGQRH